jgi:hypothetical protein
LEQVQPVPDALSGGSSSPGLMLFNGNVANGRCASPPQMASTRNGHEADRVSWKANAS